MKRRVFAAVLIGTMALGGILAYSVSKGRTPQAFFEAGKKHFEAKRYPEAIVSFLNSVRKDPRHRDSRYFLALSYLSQQDLAHAVGQLEALLENHPDDVTASLELGGIYLAGGRTNPELFRRAQGLAQKVLSREPQNVAALVLSGNAASGLQDFGTALDLLEQAVRLDPESVPGWISLGGIRALQNNYAEAEKAFLKAREANPKDKSAIVSLGNYYRAAGDATRAEGVLKDALLLYPAEKAFYSYAAAVYSQSERFDDVEKVLRDAYAQGGNDPAPALALASFYQVRNRAADARKLLLESRSKFPQSLELSIQLAANLIPDQPEDARREIDRILKTAPARPDGYVLLGKLQFTHGQFDAAEVTLGKEPALSSPFPAPHFLLGKIAARKGHIDQAQHHYQKSLAVNGRFLPARVALAETFMVQGKLADSREEIRRVLNDQPGNVPARLLNAELDMANQAYPAAERELSTLVKEQPDNPDVQRQMGRYWALRGKNAEAERNLIRALELSSYSEQSFRDLTLFYIDTKQTDRAILKLNNIPDTQKQAFHHELLGVIALQNGKSQDAENEYNKALEKDPNSLSAETLLFDLYLKNGRLDECLRKLEALARKDPLSSGVHALKGALLERQGRNTEAEESYVQALQGDPTIDLAANNLAYLLAEDGRDLHTALAWAQGVRKRQPQDANAADTLGWVYYKLGHLVLAREQALFAVSREPGNGVFQYHLGLIYKANNEKTKAEIALKKAAASPQDFKEKGLAAAALRAS